MHSAVAVDAAASAAVGWRAFAQPFRFVERGVVPFAVFARRCSFSCQPVDGLFPVAAASSGVPDSVCWPAGFVAVGIACRPRRFRYWAARNCGTAAPWRGRWTRDALHYWGAPRCLGALYFPFVFRFHRALHWQEGPCTHRPACLAGTTPLLKSAGLAVAAMGGLP